MIVVADAGPLIALAKVGGLSVLFRLFPRILVPQAVYEEVVTSGLRLGALDATLLAESFRDGLLEISGPAKLSFPVPARLGPGEEEGIRLAIQMDADWLLVDDFAARQAAVANFQATRSRARVKGTLGIIVSACQQKLLTRDEGIALVEALNQHRDIWLGAALCKRVIALLAQADDFRHDP